MFYTIIAGKPPFESAAVKETLELVSKAVYELPKGISQTASDLISRILLRNPFQRISIQDVLRHEFFQSPSHPLKDVAQTKIPSTAGNFTII